ncbi:MAG: YwaF family protein [Bacilli bacterium]|nr:YwaF family protein [Bacilli bacterium]
MNVYVDDWLNREPPYAFTWDHFLFIFIYIFLGILLAFYLRKKSRKTITIVLICLWILFIAVEAFYLIALYIRSANNPTEYPFDMKKMLPLHTCLMPVYVFPFAIFSKNEVIKRSASSYLVIVNMIMGFITLFVGCPGGNSALSYFGQHTLIYHALDVIIPLIMLVTGYYDIKKNDIYYGLAVFGILAIAVYIFDAITKCDYFFFYDGSTFPVFGFISSNVPNIVWTLIVVFVYVAIAFITHFSVIGIKTYFEKRKAKKAANP